MPRVIVLNTPFTQRPGLFAVTPPLAGGPVKPTFVNLTNITESGGVYTSTASGVGFWLANMVSDLQMPGDGYVAWPIITGATPETGLVGLDPAETHTGEFETVDFSLNNYNGTYHRFKNGTLTNSTVPAIAGDIARIRRAGTTLYYEYQRGGGAWVTLDTLTETGVSGSLTIHVLLRSLNNYITNIVASGLE